MISYTPSSATPNEAWARRTFSATRCSWVPEKKAPATSAPTTTSATIAMASAMPRSFFKTCLIHDSLVYMKVSGVPSVARDHWERPWPAARVVAQRDEGDDAVHLVGAQSTRAPDRSRRLGAQHDLDLRHSRRVGRHRPIGVEVRERHPVRADEGADEGLDRAAGRGIALPQ